MWGVCLDSRENSRDISEILLVFILGISFTRELCLLRECFGGKRPSSFPFPLSLF